MAMPVGTRAPLANHQRAECPLLELPAWVLLQQALLWGLLPQGQQVRQHCASKPYQGSRPLHHGVGLVPCALAPLLAELKGQFAELQLFMPHCLVSLLCLPTAPSAGASAWGAGGAAAQSAAPPGSSPGESSVWGANLAQQIQAAAEQSRRQVAGSEKDKKSKKGGKQMVVLGGSQRRY